ncbi:S-adenosyl-L-methionine-dependent methyltransferase [Exophiala viscosa]|uniref:tRNA wybutosine-synthesizing protein 2 n=1 Tax=Exophiala viscosa TaxID=2486360 RepID=A0AAN6DQQ0_9EURO|nr:S-adenosyl-L-methionine-dependent methyltransferase [Exophiala viscosa]
MSQERPARRARPKKPANPLVKGIAAYCGQAGVTIVEERDSISQNDTGHNHPHITLSLADLPKRYTIYAPLLLLPFNFPTHSSRWTAVYSALTNVEKNELFQCIAEDGFAGTVSRIAINAPIAAEEGADYADAGGMGEVENRSGLRKENVLRSPSGLVPVYGGWGLQPGRKLGRPTAEDFEQAFWTSTSQHKGITQCWAPLYTMFSRGNISEKARILGSLLEAGKANNVAIPQFAGLTDHELGESLGSIDVVDFYVGIGYFASCYLARGVRRVWGWDINPWSIEGLRRGCEQNGWGCLVVEVDDQGNVVGMKTEELVEKILKGDRKGDEHTVRCVAFLGNNMWAYKVMGDIHRRGVRLNARHANLGLLPTSEGSWEGAVKVILRLNGAGRGGWLHVHENVDVRHIETMESSIIQDIGRMLQGQSLEEEVPWTVSCDHVAKVKTYAPGVMHCVFDIQIKPNG